MSDQELILPDNAYQTIDIATFRSPDSVIKEAEMVAKAFGQKARQLSLYKEIGESKHLLIEGWQLLASMYRVTASVTRTEYVTYGDASGFESHAEALYFPTGRVVSQANAMCMNDEDKWGPVTKYEWLPDPDNPGKQRKEAVGYVNKPLQQLRSMSETRAMSKVLSNLFKAQARMAGFAASTADEMTGHENDGQSQRQPQKTGTSNSNDRSTANPFISEAQQRRLFAIGKGAGRSNDQYMAILQSYGFISDKVVTKDKYEAVCSAVEKGEHAPEQTPAQGQ